MAKCCEREAIAGHFDGAGAAQELERFRTRGPIRSTKLLLDALRAAHVEGGSLLDVGGGVGVIHHVLLDAGAREALQVDLSPDYIAASREEAARRGHAERVRFAQGDFVELAASLPNADVVTLDRVICCYPDMAALVDYAAAKTRHVLGAVYPVDAWWMRLSAVVTNALRRLNGSAFRFYVHPPAAIDAALRGHGLTRATRRRTIVWEIVTYTRRA